MDFNVSLLVVGYKGTKTYYWLQKRRNNNIPKRGFAFMTYMCNVCTVYIMYEQE